MERTKVGSSGVVRNQGKFKYCRVSELRYRRLCLFRDGGSCKFFMWDEEKQSGTGAPPSVRGGFRGGRGRVSGDTGRVAGSEINRTVICSKCKQPGHYARQCPS